MPKIKQPKFKAYKNRGVRPSENYSIRYNDETIVAIIPDYIDLPTIQEMVKALNKNIPQLSLGW